MTQSSTITLKDGRKLAYAEYGDRNGKPVFHFHGSGGSRLEYPVSPIALKGIRYISTDRPGHGDSDFVEAYTMLDFPDDIVQLADYLQLDKFYVLGWSAGGPRALACAYKYPERVAAVALVAGFAPPDRPNALAGLPLLNRFLIWSGMRLPFLAKLQIRMMSQLIHDSDVEKSLSMLLSSVPDADKAVLQNRDFATMLVRSIKEGYKDWRGPFQDGMLQVNPWHFDIGDIKTRVDIWQGDADVNVPLASGQYLEKTLANTRAFYLSGKGHFFILENWAEVLQKLIE